MQRTPRLRLGSMADVCGAGSLIRAVRRLHTHEQHHAADSEARWPPTAFRSGHLRLTLGRCRCGERTLTPDAGRVGFSAVAGLRLVVSGRYDVLAVARIPGASEAATHEDLLSCLSRCRHRRLVFRWL